MRRETAWTVLLAAGTVAWLAGTALHAAPLRWFGAAVGIGLAPGLAAARARAGHGIRSRPHASRAARGRQNHLTKRSLPTILNREISTGCNGLPGEAFSVR